MELYVGCVADASLVSGYEGYMRDAGFGSVLIVDNGKDLNVYQSERAEEESCCGTSTQMNSSGSSAVGVDLKSVDFNAYAGSYNIYAVKG